MVSLRSAYLARCELSDAVPGAEAIPYNCAQQAETLVSNALELGRQVILKADELDCLCTEFAAHHGLLGLDIKTQASSKRVLRLPATVRSVNLNTVRCWAGSKKSCWDCIGIFSAPVASFPARGWAAPRTVRQSAVPLDRRPPPQVLWGDSLLAILRLAYAGLITSPAPVLKVC